MGRFKEDVERLSNEVRCLHEARKRFMEELRMGAADSRAAVSEMRAASSLSHAEMAGTGRAERAAFLVRLKSAVAAQRKEFADDLAGARCAWLAKTS